MSRLHSAAAVTTVCALSAAVLLAAPPAATAADSRAAAPASGLVLNEIVYDDAATGLADQIEIYNAGAEAVALDGWYVSDEKRDVFGHAPVGATLAPGEFLVLVKDVDFDFGLGKGDEVVLYDPAGTEVGRLRVREHRSAGRVGALP